jgi:hypothetical protein
MNTGYTGCLPSALSEIRTANAGGEVAFINGCHGGQACTSLQNQSLVRAAVAAADVTILVLGEAIGVTNGEGRDRSSYALSGMQTQLAQLVGNVSKPTVVIILSGGAVGMDWIAGQAWPILIPGYSGIFGPRAIARTLFGETSPSGLLPYTVYPDSWDANCYTKGATKKCGNDLHDMGLTSGDGRTYRWYSYRNASLQATAQFGSGETHPLRDCCRMPCTLTRGTRIAARRCLLHRVQRHGQAQREAGADGGHGWVL